MRYLPLVILVAFLFVFVFCFQMRTLKERGTCSRGRRLQMRAIGFEPQSPYTCPLSYNSKDKRLECNYEVQDLCNKYPFSMGNVNT